MRPGAAPGAGSGGVGRAAQAPLPPSAGGVDGSAAGGGRRIRQRAASTGRRPAASRARRPAASTGPEPAAPSERASGPGRASTGRGTAWWGPAPARGISAPAPEGPRAPSARPGPVLGRGRWRRRRRHPAVPHQRAVEAADGRRREVAEEAERRRPRSACAAASARMRAMIWAGVRPAHGPAWVALPMHSATEPATCGVAMLVPDRTAVPPPRASDVMHVPGAATVCAAPALVAAKFE